MIRRSRKMIVQHTVFITPNMKRITFTGDDLKDLSSKQNGYYIKLVIPDTASGFFGKSKVRSYTIRDFDDVSNEMIVDFAMHEPAGPATKWAKSARVGDEVDFMGPGPKKLNTNVDGWYLFAADMSAIPAAVAAIETLPKTAKGEVIFEITSEEDVQHFDKPEGLNVNWLVHPHPENISLRQLEVIEKLDIPALPNIFVAGELNAVKKIKKYLLNNDNVSKSSNVYISSYWKIGNTDEQHKRAKMAL